MLVQNSTKTWHVSLKIHSKRKYTKKTKATWQEDLLIQGLGKPI